MFGLGSHMTRGLRRSAALALGGLLLVSLLAAEAHRVVALHAVCSEHGELIHLEASASRPATRGAGAAFADGATAALEGAHGCAALLLLATAFVGSAPDTAAPSPRTEPRRSSARPRAVELHRIPLLLQAPKHSPPTA
jgi:hypothetical protein